MRCCLVEDDAKAARVLSRGLQEEGFVVDVAPAGDIGQALAAAAHRTAGQHYGFSW